MMGSGDPTTGLPDAAWLAALVSLPGVGPARLSSLLETRSSEQAWFDVAQGSPDITAIAASKDRAASWSSHCSKTDVARLWDQYRRSRVGVLAMESPGYPEELLEDPEPPSVLFTRGDPTAIEPVCVGIVGTRQCTRYGVDLARELGGLLADAGVSVVSGLAAGIDAAAHLGALESGGAAPIAVVGTALDNAYPRRNAGLWADVAAAGLVCGETPLGAPVEKWRFPARNRIIAGLSRIVVVVESHERGGSLYTAAQAMDRDKTVFAVPGPIRSPASAGCNRLLADGCLPLCEVADVLVAVDLAQPTVERQAVVRVTTVQGSILDAIGWAPVSLEEIARAVDLSFDQVALTIEQLASLDLVGWRGRWIERTARSVQVGGPKDLGLAPIEDPLPLSGA